MNVVIPMAGLGKRFKDIGYKEDKPFIQIEDRPMVVEVIKNLHLPSDSTVYLISRKLTEEQKYTLYKKLALSVQLNYQIIELDEVTEGAACTVLKAPVDMSKPLLIANSDQLVLQPDYMKNALGYWKEYDYDAGILTCLANKPHFSFVMLDENGLVCRVVEKVVVSHVATVGVYYFKRALDFWNSTNTMIKENIRYNNEFYVAPVFNVFLRDLSMRVACYTINGLHCIGTPEGLKRYLDHKGIR